VTFDFAQLRDEDGYFPDDIIDLITGQDPRRKMIADEIRGMIVTHSRFNAAKRFLYNALACCDAGREGVGLLFYGEPGVGKSSVIDAFEQEYSGPFKTRTGLVRPVLRVNTPSKPTLGELFTAILSKFGVDDYGAGNLRKMKAAIRIQFKLQNTKLLILDEFTHVVEDKTEYFTKTVIREIKELMSDKVCDIILAGTQRLPEIAELYEQVQRRGEGEMHMTPFNWEINEDQAEWKELLSVISGGLPIPPKELLADESMARTLYVATRGNCNSLMKLLLLASFDAHDLESPFLSEEHLWAGFEAARTILAPRTASSGLLNRSVRNPFPQPSPQAAKLRLIKKSNTPVAPPFPPLNSRTPRKTREKLSA
jgi:hypothetical protein